MIIKKISKIYKNFERNISIDKNFIVAVSGGPDSLSLAALAKEYSFEKKRLSDLILEISEIKDLKRIRYTT